MVESLECSKHGIAPGAAEDPATCISSNSIGISRLEPASRRLYMVLEKQEQPFIPSSVVFFTLAGELDQHSVA